MSIYTISQYGNLIGPVKQCHSPNQDDRPDSCEPELIIIHGIRLPPGEFGGPYVEQLFTNCLDWDVHPYFAEIKELKVSSHLFIRRDGGLIQFVPFSRRAWHAGASRYRDRKNCNDFSIGIELEGEDEIPYADPQYNTLLSVIIALQTTYTYLCARRIVGHCDVSPDRKLDPGPAFDWLRLYAGLSNNTE